MQVELPTPTQVAEALERVYARPALGPPPPGLLDPLWAAVGRVRDAVGRFFSRLGGGGDTEWLQWLTIVVLAAVGVAIVAYFLHQTLSRLGAAGPRARSAEGAPARGARARTAPEWDALAARLAREGRYREAALALYQGLLLRLEASGVVRYDPAKTPGEYRREARPHPRGGTLGEFLRGFEPVAFGGRAIEADGYERLRAAAGADG